MENKLPAASVLNQRPIAMATSHKLGDGPELGTRSDQPRCLYIFNYITAASISRTKCHWF